MRNCRVIPDIPQLGRFVTFPVILTVIIFDLFKCGVANGANTVGRNGSSSRKHSPEHVLNCYVCRSDYNQDCLHNVANYWEELSQQCTDEVVEAFYNQTQIDPISHPLPHFKARSSKPVWGCYTLFSTDGLFTLRSCATEIKTGDKHGCHPCYVPQSDNRPAKCCTCFSSWCNDKSSSGAYPTPAINRFSKTFVFIQVLIILTLFGVKNLMLKTFL